MKRTVLSLTAVCIAALNTPAVAQINATAQGPEVVLKLATVLSLSTAPTIEASEPEFAEDVWATLGQGTVSMEELTARFTTDAEFSQSMVMLAINHSTAINDLFNEVIEDLAAKGHEDVYDFLTGTILGDRSAAKNAVSKVVDDIIERRGFTVQTTTSPAQTEPRQTEAA